MQLTRQAVDTDYEGFYDGQNKVVPDGAEFEIAVVDGFFGQAEGEAIMTCVINIVIVTPGEFCGQKYAYKPKLWDMDPSKRDLAFKNLGLLDAQAGYPMDSYGLDLSTETIQQHWAGKCNARVKFGKLAMTDQQTGEPRLDENTGEPLFMNFIRGFAFLRDKMRPDVALAQQQQGPAMQEQQPTQQPVQQQAQQVADDDIGF